MDKSNATPDFTSTTWNVAKPVYGTMHEIHGVKFQAIEPALDRVKQALLTGTPMPWGEVGQHATQAPNLRRVIAGAIYDFAGRLTTGPALTVGSAHNAGPMAEACEQFLRERGCSDGEPMVRDWQEHTGAPLGPSNFDREQEALAAITGAALAAGLGYEMARRIGDAALANITKAKVL